MKRLYTALISIAFLAAIGSCTAPQKKQEPQPEPAQEEGFSDDDYFGAPAEPLPADSMASSDAKAFKDQADKMEGYASWYGKNHQGRVTASGEPFDMHKMTAAHRTLEFGTKVKVTNLENGKTAIVRITDRGPFVDGRIIDVSKKAARKLEFVKKGYAQVKLEVVGAGEVMAVDNDEGFSDQEESGNMALAPQKSNGPKGYTIQVGAFKDEKNAVHLKDKLLQEYGEKVYISQANGFFIVWVGDFPSLKGAKKFKGLLSADGYNEAFIYKSGPGA